MYLVEGAAASRVVTKAIGKAALIVDLGAHVASELAFTVQQGEGKQSGNGQGEETHSVHELKLYLVSKFAV